MADPLQRLPISPVGDRNLVQALALSGCGGCWCRRSSSDSAVRRQEVFADSARWTRDGVPGQGLRKRAPDWTHHGVKLDVSFRCRMVQLRWSKRFGRSGQCVQIKSLAAPPARPLGPASKSPLKRKRPRRASPSPPSPSGVRSDPPFHPDCDCGIPPPPAGPICGLATGPLPQLPAVSAHPAPYR